MWVARIDEKPLFRKQGIIKATAVCKSVISRKSVHLPAAAAIHFLIYFLMKSNMNDPDYFVPNILSPASPNPGQIYAALLSSLSRCPM